MNRDDEKTMLNYFRNSFKLQKLFFKVAYKDGFLEQLAQMTYENVELFI